MKRSFTAHAAYPAQYFVGLHNGLQDREIK